MYVTCKGLVLRVTPYNDTDALVTILTTEQGRVCAKVRGLRRKNSPMSAPCQLLCYSEFTLFAYKDHFTVNEASTIETFAALRKDLQKLSLATYFAQAAEVMSQEDMPTPELLSLLLNCLYALSSLNLPENQVKAVFEMRAACLSGYAPDLSLCHICGEAVPDCIDINEGVTVCHRCIPPGAPGLRIPISPGILWAMRYICQCDPKKIFAFQLPDEGLEKLSQVTEAYLSTQLERGFSALDFYKSLFYRSDDL